MTRGWRSTRLALALGNLAAGASSNHHPAAQGHPAPLTTALIVMDCVVGLSVMCLAAAARRAAAVLRDG